MIIVNGADSVNGRALEPNHPQESLPSPSHQPATRDSLSNDADSDSSDSFHSTVPLDRELNGPEVEFDSDNEDGKVAEGSEVNGVKTNGVEYGGQVDGDANSTSSDSDDSNDSEATPPEDHTHRLFHSISKLKPPWDENDADEDSEAEDTRTYKNGLITANEKPYEDLDDTPQVTVRPDTKFRTLGTIENFIDNYAVINGSRTTDSKNTDKIADIGTVVFKDDLTPISRINELMGTTHAPYYTLAFKNLAQSQQDFGLDINTKLLISDEHTQWLNVTLKKKEKFTDASNLNDEELENQAEFSDDDEEVLKTGRLHGKKAKPSRIRTAEMNLKDKQNGRSAMTEDHFAAPTPAPLTSSGLLNYDDDGELPSEPVTRTSSTVTIARGSYTPRGPPRGGRGFSRGRRGYPNGRGRSQNFHNNSSPPSPYTPHTNQQQQHQQQQQGYMPSPQPPWGIPPSPQQFPSTPQQFSLPPSPQFSSPLQQQFSSPMQQPNFQQQQSPAMGVPTAPIYNPNFMGRYGMFPYQQQQQQQSQNPMSLGGAPATSPGAPISPGSHGQQGQASFQASFPQQQQAAAFNPNMRGSFGINPPFMGVGMNMGMSGFGYVPFNAHGYRVGQQGGGNQGGQQEWQQQSGRQNGQCEQG